jgi:precorrin-3B synthase
MAGATWPAGAPTRPPWRYPIIGSPCWWPDSGLRLPARAAVTGLLATAAVFLRRRGRDQRIWRVAELPGGPLELVDELRGELRARLGDAVGGGPSGSVPDRDQGGTVGWTDQGGTVGWTDQGGTVGWTDQGGTVGRIDQTDGRVAIAASVPLGELTPARCEVIASVAEREVLLTPWRGVVLPGLPPAATDLALRRLAGAGLVVDPSSPRLGVSACTGRPGCAQALADVRADASIAAGRAAGAAVPPGDVPGCTPRLPVHWSGCDRRCGRPPGPVVDVVAAVDGGYRVSRAGQVWYAGADLGQVRAAAAHARGAATPGHEAR